VFRCSASIPATLSVEAGGFNWNDYYHGLLVLLGHKS
jgi:hypothetical protein